MSATDSLPSLPPLPAGVLAGRVPQWNLERLAHRACPVCGADRPEPLCRRPDRLVVAACAACGMRYLPEVPDAAQLDDFYRDYGEYKQVVRQLPSLLYRLMPVKPADPFVEILRHSGGLAGRSLCEVGCSFGSFLRRARAAGARVHGVELDERAVAELRRDGIDAARTLDPARRFEVFCAFHVIEHLADPGAFAAEAARALPDDGRVLLALPNGGEGERVGSPWLGYRVDLEHLNYFGVATLTRMLARHGLWVEQFWECQQPNVPRRGDVTPRGPLHRLAAWLEAGSAALRPEQGTYMLVVLARKAPAAAGGDRPAAVDPRDSGARR